MKTQFGELVTGDFEENTLTIEIDGEMEIQAGRYAVVPIDDYNRLVKKCDLADVGKSLSELKNGDVFYATVKIVDGKFEVIGTK